MDGQNVGGMYKRMDRPSCRHVLEIYGGIDGQINRQIKRRSIERGYQNIRKSDCLNTRHHRGSMVPKAANLRRRNGHTDGLNDG